MSNTKVDSSQVNGDAPLTVKNAPYGAKGNGIADDTIPVQQYFSDLRLTGGTAYFPHGIYNVNVRPESPSHAIGVALTNLTSFPVDSPYSVNIKGEGAGNTVIQPLTPSKYAMLIEGANTGIAPSGNPYLPHIFTCVRDIAFSGFHRGHGVHIYKAAHFSMENVIIDHMDQCMYLESVLSCEFYNLRTFGNFKGIVSDIGTGFSSPNAIKFFGGGMAAGDWAFRTNGGGTNIVFDGTNIEGSGTHGDMGTGGINLTTDGRDGAVGFTLTGMYFEGNSGAADVVITNTSNRYMTHTITDCNFHRNSSAYHTINNIRSNGKNIINLVGCTFEHFGSYVPDGSRIYLNGDSDTIFTVHGCSFKSSVESHNLSLNHGMQVVHAGEGFVATDCPIAFSAQSPNKSAYFESTTLAGGGLLLGHRFGAGTPFVGFRSSGNSNVEGIYDAMIHGQGGDGTMNAGNVVHTALTSKFKHIGLLEDAVYNIGTSALRAGNVFSANGVTTTSDEREKFFISITDTERAVAAELKANLSKFKFLHAMEVKGDGARIHFGIGAQTVKAIFEKHGLDGFQYGLLCYDAWDQVERVLGENGEILIPEQLEGNRFGIRYNELLCFILSAI